jgi:hypothetical protein
MPAGANTAALVLNFRRWLDELAMEAVNPLVRYFDGNRLEEGFIIR